MSGVFPWLCKSVMHILNSWWLLFFIIVILWILRKCLCDVDHTVLVWLLGIFCFVCITLSLSSSTLLPRYPIKY